MLHYTSPPTTQIPYDTHFWIFAIGIFEMGQIRVVRIIFFKLCFPFAIFHIVAPIGLSLKETIRTSWFTIRLPDVTQATLVMKLLLIIWWLIYWRTCIFPGQQCKLNPFDTIPMFSDTSMKSTVYQKMPQVYVGVCLVSTIYRLSEQLEKRCTT